MSGKPASHPLLLPRCHFESIKALHPRARACAHTANSIFIYKSMLWKDISTSKSLEYSPTGSAWNVHIYTWSNLGSDVHKGPCSHWPRRPQCHKQPLIYEQLCKIRQTILKPTICSHSSETIVGKLDNFRVPIFHKFAFCKHLKVGLQMTTPSLIV